MAFFGAGVLALGATVGRALLSWYLVFISLVTVRRPSVLPLFCLSLTALISANKAAWAPEEGGAAFVKSIAGGGGPGGGGAPPPPGAGAEALASPP